MTLITKAKLKELRKDIATLEALGSMTEYSLSADYLKDLIDTLEKSLAVVEAAKALHPELQSDPVNFKLVEALGPFQEREGK